MEEAIITMVVQIIGELALAAIGIAGTWLLAKMAKRSELVTISNAIHEAVSASQETVLELQQTVVDKWKAANEDGKLTEEEINSLGSMLLSKTLNKMSGPAAEILNAAGVDISAVIKGAAEAMIAQMKNKA